jgi:hypothetical protein
VVGCWDLIIHVVQWRIYIYIYIYIYVCVCVCVCVQKSIKNKTLRLRKNTNEQPNWKIEWKSKKLKKKKQNKTKCKYTDINHSVKRGRRCKKTSNRSIKNMWYTVSLSYVESRKLPGRVGRGVLGVIALCAGASCWVRRCRYRGWSLVCYICGQDRGKGMMRIVCMCLVKVWRIKWRCLPVVGCCLFFVGLGCVCRICS